MDDDEVDYTMVDILTRIATDLERLLYASIACGGLLAFIAGLMLLRLMLGR